MSEQEKVDSPPEGAAPPLPPGEGRGEGSAQGSSDTAEVTREAGADVAGGASDNAKTLVNDKSPHPPAAPATLSGGPNGRGEERLPITRRAWWAFLYTLTWIWMSVCYGYRSWGRRRVPREGAAILASNHQSFFDPILVGLGLPALPCFAIARSTLFTHRIFSWLMMSLNAIPVKQGESDMIAMRKSIDVLKEGHRLMIFPEGSRTPDGAVHEFKPGTMLLIRRAKAPVVPVAIEGAFESWPIQDKLPRPTGRIGVMYGQPIPAERLLAMETGEALAYLANQIESMRVEVRKRLSGACEEENKNGDADFD